MAQFVFLSLIQDTSQETSSDEGNIFPELVTLLHQRVQAMEAESSKTAADSIQKSGAGLRGNLSQFLSTPLKSDKDEIDRAIRDTFENMLSQMGYSRSFGSLRVGVYKIIDPQSVPLHRQLVGVIRRILKNGRTLLADAGVSTGKNAGQPYLLSFVVNDFMILPHVKSEFESTLAEKVGGKYSTVSESIGSVIHSLAPEVFKNKFAIVVDFDADDEVADRLQMRLKTIAEQFGVSQILLTKRSFAMGFSSLFQLTFSVDIDAHAIGSVIMALVDDDPELEDALTIHGSLLVLEKIAESK